MLLYPNCKINIGLRVIRKREDGYHDLETIFYPVKDLHDTLEINPACSFCFEQTGIKVDCPTEDNLIIKCYNLMKGLHPHIGPVAIRFEKNIPFGAGLGGGSSDAAHTAIALNEIFHLGLSKDDLAHEIRPLGADCPFFVYNSPCYAEGIGDLLTPISQWNLDGIRIVMIKPQAGVSTREAYSNITKHPEVEGHIWSSVEAITNSFTSIDVLTAHPEVFANDFESTIFPLHSDIEEIKKTLLEAGAIYASMSGSGSTVFGLFENDGKSSTNARLAGLHKDFASMILLDDTL